MTRSKTFPVLQQTDTHVQDARKGDDAQGFDGVVKRARHVNWEVIHVSDARSNQSTGWNACRKSYFATLRPSTTPATPENR